MSIKHCLPFQLAGGSGISAGKEPALVIREGEEKRIVRGGEANYTSHRWLHKFSVTSGLTSAGGAQAASTVEPPAGALGRGLEVDSCAVKISYLPENLISFCCCCCFC